MTAVSRASTRRTTLIIGSIAFLALAGAACGNKTPVTPVNRTVQNVNDDERADVTVPSLSNTHIETNTAVTTNDNTNNNVNVDTGASDRTSNEVLTVDKPGRNDTLTSPFSVTGTTSAPNVYVRVKNASGAALFTEAASVKGADFSINLSFEFSRDTAGTVEVFTRDSSDHETNLIAIPVAFTAGSTLPDTTGTMPSLGNTNGSVSGNVNADDQNVNGAAY